MTEKATTNNDFDFQKYMFKFTCSGFFFRNIRLGVQQKTQSYHLLFTDGKLLLDREKSHHTLLSNFFPSTVNTAMFLPIVRLFTGNHYYNFVHCQKSQWSQKGSIEVTSPDRSAQSSHMVINPKLHILQHSSSSNFPFILQFSIAPFSSHIYTCSLRTGFGPACEDYLTHSHSRKTKNYFLPKKQATLLSLRTSPDHKSSHHLHSQDPTS